MFDGDLDLSEEIIPLRRVVLGSPIDPRIAHRRSAEVLCRLESLRSGTPQLSKKDVTLRLVTWQYWELCQRSYARAARRVSRWRGRPISRQHVYYLIQAMRNAGILDGIQRC